MSQLAGVSLAVKFTRPGESVTTCAGSDASSNAEKKGRSARLGRWEVLTDAGGERVRGRA